MSQAVQIAGAIGILLAFAGAQAGLVNPRSWAYLWLNLVGAAALASSAGYEEQWGFLLLNSVWSAVAAIGIVARIRSRDRPARDSAVTSE
ncbi:MAG: hypothetical protein H0W87_02270 [Actinobacteria bacterium]|nr:hypothetical protein [Actinomycetota bacterium]